ncbi:MAG: tRNA (N(6)-L-threonylcarbamoyladenosine(37)-C(2))-methylthiotransferase MtaB [Saccharofermentans sp.]|nr:tRNA (N(6)-L-threonylcarbamoyladenosine(37)-C(2))-methylthiotransferase MtaB [Saccharofermentans sp.]
MSSKGKVWFSTLGCRVNQYETDAARELFISSGYEIVVDPSQADICIVNTCTVTGEADRKSRQRLRGAARLNPEALIVAMGCASEMASGELDADIVLGTRDKNDIVTRVEKFLADKKVLTHKSLHARPALSKSDVFHDFGTIISPEGSRAFMKIEDGCNNFCTYCIIPFARGRVASRSRESITEEARNLASLGFKEIIVSGIEVCSYGSDRGEGIESFLGVLQDIAAVSGIERIRLGSLEPSSLTDEFIEGMSGIKQMCPHFHLSLQSGSDTVLKRMNRKYDTALYLDKVGLLRKAFSGMKLTTDIICGFPGETDEEFEQTYEFVNKCGIDKVHVFPYSVREGTKAASMKQVSGTVKKVRTDRLRKLSDEREVKYAGTLTGKRLEVLVENFNEYNDGIYGVGYSREYVYCLFKVEEVNRPQVGSIVEVEACEPYSAGLLCRLL